MENIFAVTVGAAALVGVGIYYYLYGQHRQEARDDAQQVAHRRQPQARFQRAQEENEEVPVDFGNYRVSQSVSEIANQ
jgi:hypothetical protein